MLGLLCPYCRKPSHNIQNVTQILAEENALIDSAFNHFKIRGSRSNEGVKRCLNLMITSGIKGVITASDLTSEDYSRPEYLVSLKLELARLEFIRKNQKKPEEYNTLPLPTAHLTGITFTRNMILERVLKYHSNNVNDPSGFKIDAQLSSTSSTVEPYKKSSNTCMMVNKSTQTKKDSSEKSKASPSIAYLAKKQKLFEATETVMKISKRKLHRI